MATVFDIQTEWAAEDDIKQELVKTKSGFLIRWLNQAQLRFADKSEMLRSVWSPTITSSGSITLPNDFLREFPDRVKRDATKVPLKKINYQDAQLVFFSTLSHYSIFAGSFYVWAAQAASPTIPYVRKPAVLSSIDTNDLETPTEFHHLLIDYMDSMWLRRAGNLEASKALLASFDKEAWYNGVKFRQRNDGLLMTRGSWF